MSDAQENGWWPYGETWLERGLRLTELSEENYLDLAKYQSYPWPRFSKEELFDYLRRTGREWS